VIEAFTQDLAAKVTGLTRRQLEYWDELGVVTPSIASHEWRLPRLYSFRDLLKLKVAAEMRRLKWLPGQIRRMMRDLEAKGFDDPLLTLRFVADPKGSKGNRVYYIDPQAGPMSARVPGQEAAVFDLKLRDLRTGLEDTIDRLTQRQPGTVRKIRQVQGSAPVLEGTRIRTSLVAQLRDEGWGVRRIIAAYPHLTRADVRAALEYEDSLPKRRTA
jgi:uncharacterized protein (DUF433 family)